MTPEQEKWCQDNQIVITFRKVNGENRVKLSCGGHPLIVERYTLEHALTSGMYFLQKARRYKNVK